MWYNEDIERRMRIREMRRKQRKFKRNVLAVMLGILMMSCVFCGAFGNTITEEQYVTVRVKSGDTLWSIAKEHFDGDVRQGIIKIKKANNLKTSDIEVAQAIKIPVE